MEIRCRRTKTRVIKTIRLNMTEMTTILDQLPEEGRVSRHNLYVVYLVRDPRGVINSVQSLKEQLLLTKPKIFKPFCFLR